MKFNSLKKLIAAFIVLTATSCSKSSNTSSGGTPATASITTLNCPTVSLNATATAGIAYSATATVPYAGGNAAAYAAGVAIISTGVTGLTATLAAGTLANGTGNLSFAITGTPSAAGTAIFSVALAAKAAVLY